LFEETDLRDLEIAAIAGHANLNTTAKYTHLRVHRMAAHSAAKRTPAAPGDRPKTFVCRIDCCAAIAGFVDALLQRTGRRQWIFLAEFRTRGASLTCPPN